MIFSGVEPFGSEAGYLGHAIVAQTVANVNRPRGKKPFKTKDFMPNFEKEEQSVKEMVEFAKMLTVGMGGEDKRGNRG